MGPTDGGRVRSLVICCPLDEARESDRFSYVAGVQVASLDDIPRGMTGVQVPAARYAVFSHVHGIGPAKLEALRGLVTV